MYFKDYFETAMEPGGLTFRGYISVSSDFPTLAQVQIGDLYEVLVDVEDNDPTRTDTGQAFTPGDDIFWTGTNWAVFGNLEPTYFSATPPLTYNPLSGVFGLDYNSTNLKITAGALNTIQDIALASSPQFAGLNLSGLTAGYAVVTDGSQNLASLQYTPSNVGSTIMSRDINGSFVAQKATLADLVVGPTQSITLTNKITYLGPNASITGPHIIAYTDADQYPVSQRLNYAHNNISESFDAYYDGTNWRSGFSGSNAQITKITNQLQFNCASGVAQGSIITWTLAGAIDLTSGGLNWNKQIKVSDSTNATSLTTGAITTLGGGSVGKDLYVGGNLIATGSISGSGADLTKTDDTNVTLTLGGTPATALLKATSLTLGWSGQLSMARGGFNAPLVASNGGIFYSTASAGAILAGTATSNQLLISGASNAPSWASRYIDYGTGNPNTIGNLFTGTGCGSLSMSANKKNTGFGINCFASLNTGASDGENSAFGYRAANSLSNVNAYGNVFLGADAGFFITGGQYNSYLGYSTGNSAAAATANQCTLVGAVASVSATGLTNATAIGYGAGVGTSNTIVLGNSSVTDINTYGRITIGAPSSTPSNIPTLVNLYSTTQIQSRIAFTGQEFYQASNTSTDGISLLLGVNRAGNRQLWITDSTFPINSFSPAFRVLVSNAFTQIGSVSTDGTTALPLLFTSSNFGFGGSGFGGGSNSLFIANAPTIPSTNPLGGALIYVTTGSIKGRGSSGTVTNIANAEPHCKKCGSDFGLGWENPRYGGEMLVCKICETEYQENLRKSIKYLFNNFMSKIANDNNEELASIRDFLSQEEAPHVVWNVERTDEYKNIRIPVDVGKEMADKITNDSIVNNNLYQQQFKQIL